MSQAQTEQKAFDLDSLLDGTLDDLADLPEFKPFPVGSYKLALKIEADKALKNVYFTKLKVIEVIELSDSSETPPAVGDESNVRSDLSNEYGQGEFKKVLGALAAHFGGKTNRELIAIASQEWIEVLAVTKQNVNKKNNAVYTQLVELVVA